MKLKNLVENNFVEKVEENLYRCLDCNKIFTKIGITNHHFYEHEDNGILKKQILREIGIKNNNTPEMKKKISEGTKKALEREEVKENFNRFVERMKVERLGIGNPMYGKHHTEEWKLNHSKIMTGFKMPEEAKEKVRKARTGKKHKKESIEIMRAAKLGKKATFETKLKMSISSKNNSHSLLSIEKIKEKYSFFSKIEEMRYNPENLSKKEIQVHCRNHSCKNSKENEGWFTPSSEHLRYRIYALESNGDYNGLYCSDECKQSCPIYGSHPESSTKSNISEEVDAADLYVWRKKVLELDNSECQICGTKNKIHVHHIIPQKLEPFFALDPVNGICLCEKCHFKYGHSSVGCKTSDIASKSCKEY